MSKRLNIEFHKKNEPLIKYSKSSKTTLQIIGGIFLIVGFIAGIGGAGVLIFFNVTKAFQQVNGTNGTNGSDGTNGANETDQTLKGTVNYWPMKNNDMTDHIGTAQPLSTSGVSFVTNRLSNSNQALDLNGQIINLQSGTCLNKYYSITLWMYLYTAPTDNSGIIDFYNLPAPTNEIGLFVYKDFDDSLLLGVYAYWGRSKFTLTSIQPLPLNTWTHVAYTWDGSNHVIYMNGLLDRNLSLPVMDSVSRSHCAFGTLSGIYSVPLYSYLDEVRVYDRFKKFIYNLIIISSHF
jgi:hypothetical protein